MTTHASFFNHGFSAGALTDIGQERRSNEDEVIVCPETGFFAVSDGMGGLLNGGKTSQLIQQLLPGMVKEVSSALTKKSSPEQVAGLLAGQIRLLSDTIYNSGNNGYRFEFGATLSGVWLIGSCAVFVNIGDSRGYLLSQNKKNIRQITRDHNEAAQLIQQGEITKKGLRYRLASSVLTRFMGMKPPAMPETFIEKVYPGDRILLCSDGLHGMMDDALFPSILQSSDNPVQVCERLVEKANSLGGDDNIAVVLIKIE